MSLVCENTVENEKIHNILRVWKNQRVSSIKRINQGGNGQVFAVMTENQKKYAVKFYFQSPDDPRDRLGTEFKAFTFLNERNVNSVPRALFSDESAQCAVYEFIDGLKIDSSSVKNQDIDTVLNFIEELKDIKDKQSLSFQPASEAFFSIDNMALNVESRLSRFLKNKELLAEHNDLNKYLTDELVPFFDHLCLWIAQECEKSGIDPQKDIHPDLRTLSSSDFGFHNAIRDKEGRIIFLDFEYFGWDDPTKFISDFIHHPAMQLTESIKSYFLNQAISLFDKDKQLAERLRLVHPLFGLKWCLIFLNEFLPNENCRRQFAKQQINIEDVHVAQLQKSKDMLNKVKNFYVHGEIK